ncbi:hypothetical protein [Brevibacillus sp. H7]|uniref:hypothetical protein n=1 Tax=Brevibacillus sp. H7 TaxID=3349138 RepID=UPI00382C686F
MKKQWTNGLLATTLALGLAIPAAAYAMEDWMTSTASSSNGKPFIQHKGDLHRKDHKKAKLRHGLSLGTHRQMYLTLLAEKYTPESVDKWEAAFAERERLMTEWKARKSDEKTDPKKQQKREEFKQFREFLKQFRQVHDEFDAAIESGDEAKIKAVMPKLLAETETINQHLAKKLEEKKN